VNFFEQVSSLIRAGGSLEDIGRGLARVLDKGHLRGFVLYGAPEGCLVTVPYKPPEVAARLKAGFEQCDWRGRPREALLAAFSALETPTGEIGENIRWSFLGPEEEPLGVFAYVRDPAAPPPPEAERKATEFFFRLAGELALWGSRAGRGLRESRERDHLLQALNQLGRLMLQRPDRARLLPSLLKIALDVARSEVGSILLLSGGRFTTEVEWGLPGELLEGIRFLPEDRTIIERLSETLEPVIVDDFSGPTVRLPDGFPVRVSSLVSLPLITGDRLTGILNVATGEDGREVLLSTVAALTTVAVLIATAVENARLGEALSARVEEAHQGRAEEQNLLRQVLASLGEGVLVSDAAGRIAMANPAAEDMLGLGSSGERRFPERNVITLRPFFAWLRERWGGATQRQELQYRLDLKPPACFAVTILPLSRAADPLSHVTVIRELAPSGALLKRADPNQVAAEIEEPLAEARSALALLYPAVGQSSDPLGWRGRRGVERLAALAEDLRDQGSLEEGGLELERAPVSLEEMAAEVAARYADEMQEKLIGCPPCKRSGLPPLEVDGLRLSRAFDRLFGAVVRATAQGGWIKTEVAQAGDRLQIRLGYLEGPGGRELDLFLDRPSEERGGAPSNAAGALGLYMARRVVELHGGQLVLERLGGSQARLVLSLPARLPERAGGVESPTPVIALSGDQD
jgi:signal transduction histidine kinase